MGNRYDELSRDQLVSLLQQYESRYTEGLIFEALCRASTDFIGIANAEGTPIWVNPAGRKMVGLKEDFDIGKTTIKEYYPESEHSLVEGKILKEMTERGYWSGETFFRNFETNEPIPVSDTHFAIRDPQSNALIGFGTITRDISNSKESEKELRGTLKRLSDFWEMAVDRELKIVELKKEINELLRETGKPPKYAVGEGQSDPQEAASP